MGSEYFSKRGISPEEAIYSHEGREMLVEDESLTYEEDAFMEGYERGLDFIDE